MSVQPDELNHIGKDIRQTFGSTEKNHRHSRIASDSMDADMLSYLLASDSGAPFSSGLGSSSGAGDGLRSPSESLFNDEAFSTYMTSE